VSLMTMTTHNNYPPKSQTNNSNSNKKKYDPTRLSYPFSNTENNVQKKMLLLLYKFTKRT
jgi:hypothetical protein